jgi:hypothetical protein
MRVAEAMVRRMADFIVASVGCYSDLKFVQREWSSALG